MDVFKLLLDLGSPHSARFGYLTDFVLQWRDNFDAFNAALFLNKKDFAFVLIERGASSSADSAAFKKAGKDIRGYIDRRAAIRVEYVNRITLEQKAAAQETAARRQHDQDIVRKIEKAMFFRAIKDGDLNGMVATLNSHKDALRWTDGAGQMPLHAAMTADSLSGFRHLINLGADVNEVQGQGVGAPRLLHLAVDDKKIEFLRCLIQNGADTRATCGYGPITGRLRADFSPDTSALDLAVKGGAHEIAALLADPEACRAAFAAAQEPVKTAAVPVTETQPEADLMQKFNLMANDLRDTRQLLELALQRIAVLENPSGPGPQKPLRRRS